MRKCTLVVMGLLLVLMAGACNKVKPPVTSPARTTPIETPPPSAPSEKPAEITEDFPRQPVETTEEDLDADAVNRRGVLKTVYFGYDEADVRPEDRSVLQGNAAWLKENPKWSVRIEGHTDERGTLKYNLALGERRASAVRDYLVSLGIEPSRLRIVTFGEEHPADPGQNETAWSKNRRGEFFVEK